MDKFPKFIIMDESEYVKDNEASEAQAKKEALMYAEDQEEPVAVYKLVGYYETKSTKVETTWKGANAR